jgi:nitrite reductase/ring-hydroxylating ferredoxin subunit
MVFKRRKELKRDAEGFVVTDVTAAAVVVDRLQRVFVDGQAILLTRLDTAIVAFAERCPHAAGKLNEIHNGRVRCPEHDYKFDVRTGRILWPADELYRLRRYPVKVVDGVIWVQT